MVDQFVIGTVDRISPEAPVPIVRFDHETWRLGGAANVAHNIVALGGRVDAIGVVGQDADGARLLDELAGRSIGTAGIISDASRCTTQEAARRDDTQSAGGADRLRERRRDRPAIEALVVRRIGELAASATPS